MKKESFLLLFFIFFFLFFIKNVSASELCSLKGYSVFTINGIFNDEIDAIKNRDKLKSKFGTVYNNEPLDINYLYNSTHLAGVGDVIDAIQQGLFLEDSDYDLTEMLNDASQKMTTQKVLLVGHSQGNFYANSFYKKVASKEGGIPKESIGVYGVASPASYVAGGGKYLTSDTDNVIATIVAKYINILKPNTHIELKPEDGNGHSFSDVYLKYQSNKIVSDIKLSLDKLKNNDEQESDQPCISPPELSTLHKIQGVALAVADPTANIVKDGVVGAHDVGVYIADGAHNFGMAIGDILHDTGVAIGKTMRDLLANAVDSLPDPNSVTTIIPNLSEASDTNVDDQNNVDTKEVTSEDEKELISENKENTNAPEIDSFEIDSLLNENINIEDKEATDNKILSVASLSESHNGRGGSSSTDDEIEEDEVVKVDEVVAPPLLTTFTIDTNTTLTAGEYNYDNLIITNNAVLTLEGDPESSNSFKGVEINAYNITVDAGASIFADGQGYQDGPGTPESYEDGASYGGKGAGETSPLVYGSALEPEDLGSGKLGGGRGGGAIKLIVTDTLKNDGIISANGIYPRASGGSIYVKTNKLEGVGNFNANGSGTGWPYTKGGGGGRIALYYNTSSFSGKAESLAGTYCFYGCNPAADAGTVGLFDLSDNSLNIVSTWMFENSLSPFNFDKIILNKNSKVKIEENVIINSDELLVDEGSSLISLGKNILNIPNIILDNTSTFLLAGGEDIKADSLSVKGGSTFTFSGDESFETESLSISGNSTVTVLPEKILSLTIPNITVENGSFISVDAKGYKNGPGTSDQVQSGGLYGGDGENILSPYVYGSAIAPVDFGSGGVSGFRGGGALRLVVSDTLLNEGVISANGSQNSSGGSVYITAKNITGSGKFSANGGGLYLGSTIYASGGGGRTAVYYEDSSFTGTVEAKGGCGSYDGWSMTCANKGTAGLFDVINNDLYIDSSWQFRSNDSPFNFNNIFISNDAKVISDNNVDITANNIFIDDVSTFVLSGSEIINAENFNILKNAIVTVLPEKILSLSVNNLLIESGASISVEKKGYLNGPGTPDEGVEAGASYGGKGGGILSKDIYGSKENPVDFGSGLAGNFGGGAIYLDILSTLENNGLISANGSIDRTSGGSIYINAENIIGDGKFEAKGGNSGWPYGPIGGGGGRIAIYYDNYSFSGLTNVLGGVYCFYGCAPAAEEGTLEIIDKSIVIDPEPDPEPIPEPLPDTTIPLILNYTFNEIAGDITINPNVTSLSLVLNASENVDWVSIKIEKQDNPDVYKIFYSGAECVDATNICMKSWDGTLSSPSGELIQNQNGIYRVKVHMKDEALNDFNNYLSPYLITVDTSIKSP